ncbi:MAG: IMP dehydrogenase [Turicibacter sp.]|jgi:IMP dehydrogenase|uniref:Inosine-5'-monophosphate dehydrogenase n=1 Tax=Turicibacter faecis TaxID=2963365 RepID=A0ABM8IL06_9FIRM|nr:MULTISPECIES: IMP dehydrogenase [unclassified Turicibacter]MCI8701006.1 IMP dehydrogenase [Turicibacter sp.]BEH91936.1 inosine-5'-monophosphate dehydrogenase [Turicibacter sp. TC023]MCU7205458.1 IMP dehydrogenase [Turicibacter sp. TA25]MCU7208961.1 IMP dehydrogenase [Turicibacter sp. 1E2]NCE79003.1 IMP dehydrogenase [Turicibacter sp. TS3]
MNSLNGKVVSTGLTFDDVLLIPQRSEVLPKDVSLKTKLTRQIELNVPIISSAMDTVTESRLAIALAHQGGVGFIHKNMTITEQAEEVRRVKLYQNGMISDPVTLLEDVTLEEANEKCKHYKVSGFPVVDEFGILKGIVTNRDLKYRNNHTLKVSEVMTGRDKLVTAPIGITLDEAKEILMNHRIEKLPLIDENGVLRGLITIKDIDKTMSYPNSCKDEHGRLRCGAAVGIGLDTMERVSALVNAGVDVITVDSAHGHSLGVINTVRQIKEAFPQLQVIGGNIVTPEAAKDLIAAGADAVKVGIGPGSICTTRVVAGVGVPQISAVNDVYEYCKTVGVPVIADGGLKLSGDFVKAIAAGADCAMFGGLFAGCEEAPGEEILYNGRRYKTYVGMGSLAAMKRGSSDRYFQGKQQEAKKLVPEGIEARVPYKGKLEDVIYQLCGGLRAGMGYCGTATIEELKTNAKFVRITNAGLRESHPHDVEITQEAPNYQK